MNLAEIIQDVSIVAGFLIIVTIGAGYAVWELVEAHRHDDDHQDVDPDGFIVALAAMAGIDDYVARIEAGDLPELAPTLYVDGWSLADATVAQIADRPHDPDWLAPSPPCQEHRQ